MPLSEANAAIGLKPDLVVAHLQRGDVYARPRRQWERAIADYNDALKLDANDTYALRSRGRARIGRKEYDLAIADETAAIGLSPRLLQAYAVRGSANHRQGRLSIGGDRLRHGRQVEAGDPDLLGGAR